MTIGDGTKSPKRTLYVGAFVHSKSLKDLDICQDGIIGVDEHGKIAFIERDEKDVAAAAKKHGWDSYETVRIRDNGFFFPGFIGKSPQNVHRIIFVIRRILTNYGSDGI